MSGGSALPRTFSGRARQQLSGTKLEPVKIGIDPQVGYNEAGLKSRWPLLLPSAWRSTAGLRRAGRFFSQASYASSFPESTAICGVTRIDRHNRRRSSTSRGPFVRTQIQRQSAHPSPGHICALAPVTSVNVCAISDPPQRAPAWLMNALAVIHGGVSIPHHISLTQQHHAAHKVQAH